MRNVIFYNFLKHVGAICRPWQQLSESATTWTTYTPSEQTLLYARYRLTPADNRGDIIREIHYGSGKPSARITHGERDETSDQTRLKPTDDPWIMPKFCSHHNRLQAQYNLRHNGTPDDVTVPYACTFTQDSSRREILAIHTVVFQHRAVWYTVISVHEGTRSLPSRHH